MHGLVTCAILFAFLYLQFRFVRRTFPVVTQFVRWTLKQVGAVGRLLFLTLPSWLGRGVGARLGDTRKAVRCVNGCQRKIPTVGVVTCRSCGYRSRRNLYAPCSCCGSTRRHVRCPYCRMSIPRRTLWTQPQPPRTYR